MSVQAITWALDYPAQSVTEKVILLVLANYANEYGVSWPSQATLAGQTSLGERTVRRVLLAMEQRRVIRRIARRRGNGSRQSDMILLAAFEGRKPAPPGMLDDEDEPGETGDRPGPPAQPANGDNRPLWPPDNRPLWPHPPVTVAALDTSKILKGASLGTQVDLRMICLAVAGPGFDREAEAAGTSAFEIARWIEAGCDLVADILPVIAARTRDIRPAPIRGWTFFTPAVLEAQARRTAPQQQAKKDCHEQDRPTRSASKRRRAPSGDYRDAWDAAIADLGRQGPHAGPADGGGAGADGLGGQGALRLAYSRKAERDREPD